MPATELPDARQLVQPVDVEDRHLRAMGAKHHVEPGGLDVAGDDLEPRVTVDDDPQASGEEVLEMRDDQCDRVRNGHGAGASGRKIGAPAF